MGRRAAVVGRRFGRWLVVRRAPPRLKQSSWVCRCKCGSVRVVPQRHLISGNSRSCGCLRSEKTSQQKRLRLKGARFGDFVVVRDVGNANHLRRWSIRCVTCGHQMVRNSRWLRHTAASCPSCHASAHSSRLAQGRAGFNLLYRRYKAAAKQRSYAWQLEPEYFYQLVSAPCLYCGAPPLRSSGTNEWGRFMYTGVDRVDNRKGYTVKNTVPCCMECNMAKHRMSLAEFAGYLQRVLAHHAASPEPLASKLLAQAAQFSLH